MMIAPETYYDMHLKGKTAPKILIEIRSLKQKIGRMKKAAEHPDYQCTILPSLQTQIDCFRQYLTQAKLAYRQAGGEYPLSAAEQKAADFNANLPNLCRLQLDFGGFFYGSKQVVCTFQGDSVTVERHFCPIPGPPTQETDTYDTGGFLQSLADLHIGEWKRRYDIMQYGYIECDGIRWQLQADFQDGRTLLFDGDNLYPYNFDRLLDLLEISF